ncbi:MAG: AsmA family protein [Bosea sp. (in: a-proteobacteria)]
MPRARILILLAALAATLVIGLVPWPLARAEFDQRMNAALMRATGLITETAPGAKVALLPSPRILLTEARFLSPDNAVNITSAKIRIDLKLLPLFTGQIVVDGLELSSPQIRLTIAEGVSAPPIVALPRATLAFSIERDTPRINLKDGSLFLLGAQGIRTIIRNINLTVADRDPGDPLLLTGAFRWRGEPVEINGQWPLPETASAERKAGTRPVFLRIISGMGSLRFEGIRRPGPIGPIEGRLDAEAGSLARALDWLGEASPLGYIADKVRLSGEAVLAASSLTMPALSLTIDAERLDGAALIRPGADGAWGVSATLAGTRLDLDRMLARSGVNGLLNDREQLHTPFQIGRNGWRSIDLRLSIEQARLAKARLSDVALQFLASPGKLDVSLARANAYKGTVKGRVSITAEHENAPFDVRLTASAERIDMAAALADTTDTRRLTGNGFIQIGLEGSGANLFAASQTMKGRASLIVRQGELTGISMADIVRRAERQPLAVLREVTGGRTAFDTITIGGPASDGIIEVTEGLMSGAGYRLALSGGIRLPERRFAMKGMLTGTNATTRLPFEISGPWSQPRIIPDMETLLRRP